MRYQGPQLLPKGLLASVIQKLGNSIYTARVMVALGTQPHSYAKIAAKIPEPRLQSQKGLQSGNQLSRAGSKWASHIKGDHRAAHKWSPPQLRSY